MKAYLLIGCIFCMFSCVAQKKEIKAKSTIKLEGKNTRIRDLIEINGYYCFSTHPDSNCIMFFEDGIWVVFSFKNHTSIEIIKTNISKHIEMWTEGKQIRWGSYWGVYKIENDTIILNRFDKGGFWKGWSLDEIRYRVVNKNTLKPIYSKSLLKADEEYYKKNSPWIENNLKLNFIPVDSLPPSDNWLKEQKWIWRNESDWKEYMKKIENKKKGK